MIKESDIKIVEQILIGPKHAFSVSHMKSSEIVCPNTGKNCKRLDDDVPCIDFIPAPNTKNPLLCATGRIRNGGIDHRLRDLLLFGQIDADLFEVGMRFAKKTMDLTKEKYAEVLAQWARMNNYIIPKPQSNSK